jgi:hypothetical protein
MITPVQAVQAYRNIPEATIEAFDDFLFWLENDKDSPSGVNFPAVESAVDLYLGRNQIEQGEQDMLNKWRAAVKTVSLV